MEWSKLKNIIILILLALNLGLLILVVLREEKSAQYAHDVLNDTVSILAENGIAVTAALPEADETLLPLTTTRNLEEELAFVSLLLGDGTTSENFGGGIYNYTGPNGTAQVHTGGEITCAFTSPLPGKNDIASDFSDLFSQLGFETQTVTDATSNTITLYQLWRDTRLCSMELHFRYSEDELVSVTGCLLTSTPAETASGSTPLSTATLLIRFLSAVNERGDICSAITDITPAYRVSTRSDTISLTPVWIITTDTKSYYLDIVDGDLDLR